MTKIIKKQEIELYDEIKALVKDGRQQALIAVNSVLLITNWSIGKLIVDKQGGNDRAEYGNQLLRSLSRSMELEFGSGFSARNLRNMRSFYLAYPNKEDIPLQLSWSICLELIKEPHSDARKFYTDEAIKGAWTYRHTEREIKSGSYFRYLKKLPTSSSSVEMIDYINQCPETSIKDPYYLDFLGVKTENKTTETTLERLIIIHLQKFIMELGRGFTFVERQKRIIIDQDSFYIDLVFYNILLDCYVLVDLKTSKLKHNDVGQMQMYVNYYDRNIKTENQKPTIGLLLCESKKDTQVSYMLPKDNRQIFASEYRLVLPTVEELKEIIAKTTDKKEF